MSLLPDKQEANTIAEQIAEAHALWGTKATLKPPQTISMYLDEVETHKGEQVHILLQEQPKRRLLSNLGWWNENKEDNPTIGYLPYQNNGQRLVVQEHSVLTFEDGTSLEVTEVNRNYLYGLWQVVKLTPHEGDNREKVVKTNKNIKTQLMRTNKEEVE